MRAVRWVIFVGIVSAASLAAVLLCAVLADAKAPAGTDPNSPESHWYRGLIVPKGAQYGGLSCCSVADCRPVETRTRDDSYQAFIDHGSFGKDAPDDWVTVPDNKILRHTVNPTGRSVACFFRGEIRCLVLATMT